MLTSRVYVLTGAVNGWLENSSPEQYSCNLMSTRQKTMRLRVHCAKTRSMFEPLDTDIKTRTRKCEVVYGTEKLLSTLDRVSCTNYFMSIENIRCSVRRIETTKPDKKNNLWQNHIVSFQYDATMRRCWVTAEANDGCFDAANANKSCVRVHGGQSSEFPIYPTTRERGIITPMCQNLKQFKSMFDIQQLIGEPARVRVPKCCYKPRDK